jgi:hypothetical protein
MIFKCALQFFVHGAQVLSHHSRKAEVGQQLVAVWLQTTTIQAWVGNPRSGQWT